jgi:hypothetical protein
MKITKTVLILCVFLFVMSANSVNAQSNPFLNAQISGPATFSHYATGCYELPNVSGASYQLE